MVARSEDVLHGMKSICNYFGRSEATILKLHAESGFPIKKNGGCWSSARSLIDQWNVDYVAGRMARWVGKGKAKTTVNP